MVNNLKELSKRKNILFIKIIKIEGKTEKKNADGQGLTQKYNVQSPLAQPRTEPN